jgi:hypothetical protein
MAHQTSELPWSRRGPPQLWGLPVNPGANERRVVYNSGR